MAQCKQKELAAKVAFDDAGADDDGDEPREELLQADARLAALVEALQRLGAELNEAAEAVAGLEEQLAAARAAIDTGAASVDLNAEERRGALEQRQAERLRSRDRQREDLAAKWEQLSRERQGEMQTKVEALQNERAGLDASLAGARQLLAKNIEAWRGELHTLDARVASLRDAMAAEDARLGSVRRMIEDELRQAEQERLERERVEKASADKARQEKERAAKAERDRTEKERQQKAAQEKKEDDERREKLAAAEVKERELEEFERQEREEQERIAEEERLAEELRLRDEDERAALELAAQVIVCASLFVCACADVCIVLLLCF